jgi:para-nitrobenzyl esterase
VPIRLLRPTLLRPRSIVAALLVAAGIVAATLALGVSGSAARSVVARRQTPGVRGGPDRPLVHTNRGPVRGFVKNAVDTFLGIPYAAPPVGPLRWRPPRPHARWHRPLHATAYGATCPQITTLGVFADPSASENCLYLNVFTPSLTRHGGRGLPVLVWIHGGANVDGESNDYDGSKLATGGKHGGSDTVVVTLNYRLGLLGFLANPALDSEGHHFGDYGIMDQQAALRWVRRNIGAFGGDPHNVTLGGQSAGAVDTESNVISPLSAGLFHHAIAESAFYSIATPLSTAVSRGQAFAQAAGCSGTDAAVAACLRGLSVAQILHLQGTASSNGPFVSNNIVDGTVVPLTPPQAFSSGNYNHMPIMGGTVEDEGNFGIGIMEYFSGPPRQPMTAADYTTDVTNTYSPPRYPAGTAAEVLAQYPLANYATPQLAYDAVTTAPTACTNLQNAGLLAQRVPVYDYTFDYQNGPYYFPAMPGFVALAAHTIDIQFLFPGYHGGTLGIPHSLNPRETTLSNELVAVWTNFARTGNPNRAGSAPWPHFTESPGVPSVLSENIPSLSTQTTTQVSANYHCAFWNTIQPS